MRISRFVPLAAALGGVLAAAGCFSRVKDTPQADVKGEALDRKEVAEATVSHWSDVSRLSARRLMEEYGVPDEVHADSLVWNNSGPWRRTVVNNVRPMAADDPVTQNVVSQTGKYNVNRSQSLDILRFDDHVGFDPANGELSSSSAAEAHNYLRLNLADDVAHGRLRPDQARDSYASIVNFEKAGKTSPYLLGLRFSVGP